MIRALYFSPACSRTQSPISSSAAGAIVSSIRAYSEGAPVVQVWNRWFRPGSSLTVDCVLPPSFRADSIAARFSLGGTWRSFSPLSARTGHLTLPERRPRVVDEEEAEPGVVHPIDQRVEHRVPLAERRALRLRQVGEDVPGDGAERRRRRPSGPSRP